MKHKLVTFIRFIKKFYIRHKKVIIGIVLASLASLATLVLACNLIIGSYGKYILRPADSRHVAVGIVLGAGVASNGKPSRELQARLDVAAQALNDGRVDRLILSGDNRFENYNEPRAMINYLVEVKNIPASKLQPDYAGRDTYQSCERASKVFGLKETIIFSAGSHLPRAIFLCRHFGMEAYGLPSGVEANNRRRRELLASVKAIFNAYVYGEETVLGTPISF